MSFNPPEVSWSKSRLNALVLLCRFQIERVEREISALIKQLCADKGYEDGEYIIGETFP